MKRFAIGVLSVGWAFAAMLLLGACVMTPQGFVPLQIVRGSGETETQELDLAGFDRIDIENAFHVTIREDEIHRVVIEVDTAVLSELDVYVQGRTLHIGLEPGVSTTDNVTLRAEIALPALDRLEAGGASQVDLAGFASPDPFELVASGASRVRAEIDSGHTRVGISGASQVTLLGARTDVVLTLSGASRVTLEGEGQNVTARASGASQVDLAEFSAIDADLSASGASSITILATGRLDANVSGASSVRYLGSPTLGDVRSSGGSTVGPR